MWSIGFEEPDGGLLGSEKNFCFRCAFYSEAVRILRSDPFCRRGWAAIVHLFKLVGALSGSLSLLVHRFESSTLSFDVFELLAIITRASVPRLSLTRWGVRASRGVGGVEVYLVFLVSTLHTVVTNVFHDGEKLVMKFSSWIWEQRSFHKSLCLGRTTRAWRVNKRGCKMSAT